MAAALGVRAALPLRPARLARPVVARAAPLTVQKAALVSTPLVRSRRQNPLTGPCRPSALAHCPHMVA